MTTSVERMDIREEGTVSAKTGIERRAVVAEALALRKRQDVARVSALIDFLFGSVEILIGLRVLLRFIGANPQNAFAAFVYDWSAPFLTLFTGLASNPAFDGTVLEITSTFGMIVYGLIAWFPIRLVWLLFYRPNTYAVSMHEHGRTLNVG